MHILIVANMRSGLGDTGLYEFVRILGAEGAEVTLRFLNEHADITHLLRDAPEYECVVAAGGDGTVSSVLYALRDTGVPVLAYPAGTANVLAWNLRLPMGPEGLARVVLEGHAATIDLGEIRLCASGDQPQRRYGFALGAGTGFAAAIMESARDLKATLGESAYIVGALRNLLPTVSRFTLEMDDTTIETEGIAVMVMNLANLQYDVKITHDSNPQDGLFEVVVLRPTSAVGLLPTVWAALLDVLQNHPRRPGLDIHTARRVRITADPPVGLEFDGEVVEGTTPVFVRVLPRAARLLVPADSPLRRTSGSALGGDRSQEGPQ